MAFDDYFCFEDTPEPRAQPLQTRRIVATATDERHFCHTSKTGHREKKVMNLDAYRCMKP